MYNAYFDGYHALFMLLGTFFCSKDSQRRRTAVRFPILELDVCRCRSHPNRDLNLGTANLQMQARQFSKCKPVSNFLFSNVFTYMHASDTKFWYTNSVEIFKLPTTCTKLPSTFLTTDPKVLFDPHRYVSMTGQWWSVRPTTLPNFYSNRPWPFLLHLQA
jgi:hypothetical protein